MTFPKTNFSFKNILMQIKNDLWCKETTTGYTTSYSWNANQLGHFTIGFCSTILFITIAQALFTPAPLLCLVALLPLLFMVYKEYGDYQKEKSHFNKTPGIFPLNTSELKKNILNVLYFVTYGCIVGITPFIFSLYPNLFNSFLPFTTLIIGFIPTYFIIHYWISKKICFQQAGLPYTFRLSYYNKTKIINENAAITYINGFMKGNINNLIISGPMRSGKTSLATAIGTELSFSRAKIRYFNLFDFIYSTNETKNEKIHNAYILWFWKDADVLIFDDASVDLLSKLKKEIYANVVNIMKTKKIIWVIEENTDNFQGLVQDIFGDEDIKIIKLQ